MMQKAIAKRLNCSRSNVTRMLKVAAEKYDVPFVDGRKRRATLSDKQEKPPVYKKLAGQAVEELWNQGKSYCEIGRVLNCNDVMAEKAIRRWHESRGLPVPTPETRRKDQIDLVKKMRDDGASTSEISEAIGVSTTSIRKWLQ